MCVSVIKQVKQKSLCSFDSYMAIFKVLPFFSSLTASLKLRVRHCRRLLFLAILQQRLVVMLHLRVVKVNMTLTAHVFITAATV